jgi:hypothetical protein
VRRKTAPPAACWESAMSLGTFLIILVVIYLLGGFSGRFGGYGYGMGHSGMGLGGVVLVVLLVLLLLGSCRPSKPLKYKGLSGIWPMRPRIHHRLGQESHFCQTSLY